MWSIFHSYVTLPEGIIEIHSSKDRKVNSYLEVISVFLKPKELQLSIVETEKPVMIARHIVILR
jgi:hypothetical protein